MWSDVLCIGMIVLALAIVWTYIRVILEIAVTDKCDCWEARVVGSLIASVFMLSPAALLVIGVMKLRGK